MVEGFLLGVISTASLCAGVFFLRFWRRTRDVLFLAFSVSFFIEGVNRVAFLTLQRPSEGSPMIYLIRLLAFLLILIAIIGKNYGPGARRVS